jgi:hypothetical protein
MVEDTKSGQMTYSYIVHIRVVACKSARVTNKHDSLLLLGI